MQRGVDAGDRAYRNVQPGLDDRADRGHPDAQARPRPGATPNVGTVGRNRRPRGGLRDNCLVRRAALAPGCQACCAASAGVAATGGATGMSLTTHMYAFGLQPDRHAEFVEWARTTGVPFWLTRPGDEWKGPSG